MVILAGIHFLRWTAYFWFIVCQCSCFFRFLCFLFVIASFLVQSRVSTVRLRSLHKSEKQLPSSLSPSPRINIFHLLLYGNIFLSSSCFAVVLSAFAFILPFSLQFLPLYWFSFKFPPFLSFPLSYSPRPPPPPPNYIGRYPPRPPPFPQPIFLLI